MSGIVYAAPPPPPPTVADLWPGTSHFLTGIDGRRWDLTSWARSGVLLTDRGVRGMDKPEWYLHQSSSPVVHGAQYHGYRAPVREVRLPLLIFTDESSQAWTELRRSFMAIMRPDIPLRWTVEHADTGTSRSLMVRFVEVEDAIETVDSRRRGWQFVTLRFVADEQPFWEGRIVERGWRRQEPVDFIGPGGAPPFYLSRSLTLANATVSNPGDEEAWPVVDVVASGGPVSSMSIAVAGGLVDAPIALAEGESLRLDYRPGRKSAVDGAGVNRDEELDAWDFRPIPAGESVPVAMEMVGDGEVRVAFTPLYHDAY